jgi:hypothetical protein
VIKSSVAGCEEGAMSFDAANQSPVKQLQRKAVGRPLPIRFVAERQRLRVIDYCPKRGATWSGDHRMNLHKLTIARWKIV